MAELVLDQIGPIQPIRYLLSVKLSIERTAPSFYDTSLIWAEVESEFSNRLTTHGYRDWKFNMLGLRYRTLNLFKSIFISMNIHLPWFIAFVQWTGSIFVMSNISIGNIGILKFSMDPLIYPDDDPMIKWMTFREATICDQIFKK